eukprot:83837-Prymnesium_polylepis.1
MAPAVLPMPSPLAAPVSPSKRKSHEELVSSPAARLQVAVPLPAVGASISKFEPDAVPRVAVANHAPLPPIPSAVMGIPAVAQLRQEERNILPLPPINSSRSSQQAIGLKLPALTGLGLSPAKTDVDLVLQKALTNLNATYREGFMREEEFLRRCKRLFSCAKMYEKGVQGQVETAGVPAAPSGNDGVQKHRVLRARMPSSPLKGLSLIHI